ncbi:zinc finger protein 622, partial [Pogonomyrmex barbatus]|uniref:Zinc finger protein 622 n=1 Tax=Pogonomyrmex barbatus TaxID=144034 RepID=A0A8N1S2L1_9HYME
RTYKKTYSKEKLYTCLTCKVEFHDLKLFRHHYNCEWHRYNMNAKVAGLPYVTLDEYLKKEAIYTENNNQIKKEQFCHTCRKKFHSPQQFDNHIVSKVHKIKLNQIIEKSNFLALKQKIEIDSDVESVSSDEWNEDMICEIEKDYCLFCNVRSKSTIGNIEHMIKTHSFFIPDIEYCTDLNGLLEYLEQKICSDFKCIWCNDSGRKMRSAQAVRMHMVDKGHCKMLFEGDTIFEYSPFYDYSSSYPDAEDANPDEELPQIPKKTVLNDEGYVMKLPSGRKIVHRSLALYYKQNVPVGTEVTKKNYNYWLRKRLFKEISFGSTEKKIEANKKTLQAIRYLRDIQANYSTKLQFKQNKLQKYFRKQTNF